jgi:hypothetical protein
MGKIFFSYHNAQQPIEPPIQWVLGADSPGVKRKDREADHSSPTSAEVKNGRTLFPFLRTFHGVVLNKLSPEIILSELNNL